MITIFVPTELQDQCSDIKNLEIKIVKVNLLLYCILYCIVISCQLKLKKCASN